MAVLKEMLSEEIVKVEWINGKNQVADELTKGKNNNGINEYLNDCKRNWRISRRKEERCECDNILLYK